MRRIYCRILRLRTPKPCPHTLSMRCNPHLSYSFLALTMTVPGPHSPLLAETDAPDLLVALNLGTYLTTDASRSRHAFLRNKLHSLNMCDSLRLSATPCTVTCLLSMIRVLGGALNCTRLNCRMVVVRRKAAEAALNDDVRYQCRARGCTAHSSYFASSALQLSKISPVSFLAPLYAFAHNFTVTVAVRETQWLKLQY